MNVKMSRKFTLVELLVVLAIVGILIGIALPAFKNMVMGSGLDASANRISRTLMLMRDKAISSRRQIAIVFPNYGAGSIEFLTVYPMKTKGKWYFEHVQALDASGNPKFGPLPDQDPIVQEYTGFIQGTKIEQLSTVGVVTAVEYFDGGTWKPTQTLIRLVPWHKYGRLDSSGNPLYHKYQKGIIFKPSMGMAGEEPGCHVRIVVSDAVRNGNSIVMKSNKKVYLVINAYTKRVTIIHE